MHQEIFFAMADDEELEKQAEEMAAKALPASLSEAAKKAKLPAVKEKILARLKSQRDQAAKTPAPVCAPAGAGPPPPHGAPMPPGPGVSAALATPEAPPPPPPPADDHLNKAERVSGVELCGDEPWFAETAVRNRLRESIAEAHKEQKILVGNPADEILRICPEDGRVLGAGAVLRLGGAHLGGYGESDIAYAYRQLSRALHPDRNPDFPRAPIAFHRLSEAADELRQGLTDQRNALQLLVSAMGGTATAQMLERPQEALFAEACRMLHLISGLAGEGDVTAPAQQRALTAFSKCGMYHHAQAPTLLSEWFDRAHLLELYASVPIRTAYDCSPKRYRAYFLCLLNRVAMVEARRFNDCVRGCWPTIMQTFPELGLWRELREAVHRRVWDYTGDPPRTAPLQEEPVPEQVARTASRSRSRRAQGRKQTDRDKNRDRRSWSRSRSGRGRRHNRWGDHRSGGDDRHDRDRDRSCRGEPRTAAQDKERDATWDARWTTTDDPGYDPNVVQKQIKDRKQRGRERRRLIEQHSNHGWRASRWGRKWRGSIAAILPSSLDTAATHTDAEARKLGVALWKDIISWLSGSDSERVLGLFRSDTQTPKVFGWDGKADAFAARGLEPDTPPCDWSFIPVSDLVLVIGDGLVGSTTEGLFANSPLGHQRVKFGKCYKTKEEREKTKKLNQEAVAASESRHGDSDILEAKTNGKDHSRGSKWDVQMG